MRVRHWMLGTLAALAFSPMTVAEVEAVPTPDRACQFALLAENDLGVDVRILFSESYIHNLRDPFRSRDEFLTLQDQRLAPGENLNIRYEVAGGCNAQRNWTVVVRIGPRGGETIAVLRTTESASDRDLFLGQASCWATAARQPEGARTDRVILPNDDVAGCDASTTRYGLAPDPEEESNVGGGGDPSGDAGGAFDLGSLQGSWRRFDSNNDRNDGMRAVVDGSQATLTFIPEGGSNRFSEGNLLWRDIARDGRLQVRGSNGAYYDARLVFEGDDRIHIDIASNGAGNDQTWDRAGPSIDGEWVLAASSDGRNEGVRVRVAGDAATIRYLPASASSAFRVGDQLWQEVGRESLQSLTTSRSYVSSGFRLDAADRLRVEVDGETQLWLRPDALDDLPDGLLDDLADGEDPDVEDAPEAPDDTREVDVPEPDPPPATACAAPSSLEPAGRTRGWSWALDTPILPDGTAPRSDAMQPGEMSTVVDIDRSFASGAPPHFSTISLPGPRYARAFRSERNLTSAELDAAVTSARDAGEVISDLEVYETDAELRHAAVFRSEPRGFAWSAQPGLTQADLEAAVQTRVGQGYRIADIEAYPTSNGTRFAAVWYRTCDAAAWAHAVDLDGQELQAMRDSLADQGFRLTDIEPYAAADGTRYAALWEPAPEDRGWEVHWDQGLTWFLNFHRRHVDEGMRLFDYEAFETPEGVRYAGIWVEHDARYDFVARDSIQALIERHVRDNDLPGTSVAVIRDGDVLYRGAVGWADREEERTAHSGTVYLAASVSKAFGGTLAALLEERGEIDLTRPTAEYLVPAVDYVRDDLPSDPTCAPVPTVWPCESIPDHHTHTVEQLLAKTACIHHYDEGPRPPRVYYRWRTEALTEIWDAPLLSRCVPGSHYHYSTHGFTYAGAALEAATGLSMASLIRYELAEPLGLSSLRAMYDEDDLPADYERARAYALANRDSLPHPQRNPSGPTSHPNNSWKILGGGLEMNALDLATFGWKTLAGEVVSPTVRDDRLWASLTDSATVWADTLNGAAPAVGLGWRVDNDDPSARRAWHHGSARGARSHLEIWRDEGLVVAIMSNRRDDDVRSILDLADDIRAVIRRLDP